MQLRFSFTNVYCRTGCFKGFKPITRVNGSFFCKLHQQSLTDISIVFAVLQITSYEKRNATTISAWTFCNLNRIVKLALMSKSTRHCSFMKLFSTH